MPEDWEKYAVKSKQAEPEIDWEQFAVKKKPEKPVSKNGSPLSGNGSSLFQDTKPVAPTVLSQDKQKEFTDTNKGYVQPKTPVVPKAKPKADGGVGTSFMAGLNSMNEGLFKIPRYIYDLAAVPQNLAADLLNMPELAADYDEVVKSSGYASPLSALDRLGDHFKGEANQYEVRTKKYEQGIVESFKDGKWSDAGNQIVNNISGSIPSIILMATTAGAGNAAKLGYVSKTITNALPFASQKNAELQDDESVPQYQKTVNATLNGLAEVIFDQSFGTQAAIANVTKLFQKEGREAAVAAAKDLTKGYVFTAIKKVQPLTSLTKGAVEEMTTQFSQNLVDKYTTNPDKDLMEGVLDAGVVGGVTTGTIEVGGTSLANLSNVYSLKQKKEVGELMKQRTDLVDDLDNDSLPEEVKSELSDKLTALDEQITAISDAGDAKIAELPEEKQIEVLAKQEKVESIEKSLQAENISDTSKAILTEQLETNQAEIDAILEEKVEVKELEKELTESIKPVKEEVKAKEKVSKPIAEIEKRREAELENFKKDAYNGQPEDFKERYAIGEVEFDGEVEINAKYDAELQALESQPVQSKPDGQGETPQGFREDSRAKEAKSEEPSVSKEEIIDVTNDKPESIEASNQVFKTAEFDLMLLKKTENKIKKHEASIKKLIEAKKAKLITPTEFDDLKVRFDDVLADYDGKGVPKVEDKPINEEIEEEPIEEVKAETPKEEDKTKPNVSYTEKLKADAKIEADVKAKAKELATKSNATATILKGQKKDMLSQLSDIENALWGDIPERSRVSMREAHKNAVSFDEGEIERIRAIGYEVSDEGKITIEVKDDGIFKLHFDGILDAIDEVKKHFPTSPELTAREKTNQSIPKGKINETALAIHRGSLEANKQQLDDANENLATAMKSSNTKLQEVFKKEADKQQAIYDKALGVDWAVEGKSTQSKPDSSENPLQKVVTDSGTKEAKKKEPAVSKVEILTEAELARKLELRKKFARLNDITNIIATIADKEFREYAGLILKEAKGEFKVWSKELIETMGDAIKEHLPKLFDELSEKKNEAKETPQEADTRKKRATVQKILNGSYSAEFKSAIGDDTIHYKELSYKITDAEASAIIELVGKEQAAKDILDLSNGMSSSTRNDIAQKVMNAYEEAGDYDSAIEVLEKLAERITDMAQGLQSLSNFPKLGKYSQVRLAQKEVTKQREHFKKQHKEKTDKVVKQFKKANKEAAEETVAKVLPKIKRADTIEPKETKLNIEYGASNKLVRRDAYLKAKKDLRGKFFSGIPTELVTIAAFHMEANSRDFVRFSRNMILDMGNKVKPYLKELYSKAKADLIANAEYKEADFLSDEEVNAEVAKMDGEAWKEKLEKALAGKKKRDAEIALAKLQEISKDEGLWGKYKAQAVSKLKGTNIANAKADIDANPPLKEFTDGLVKNLQAKIEEALPEKVKAERPKPRPAIEVLGDAYKNFEKYAQVWEQTQEAFKEKYKDNPEVLNAMDAYFGEILDNPFSEKVTNKAVTEGLKEMGTDIGDLVLQHYTVLDNTKRTLADKLIDEAGLEGREAYQLAEAIEKEFDKIATKKKEQILERIFSTKERKKPAVRTMEGDIIKLSNLGAFRDDALVDIYGDKMGWPKLTEQNIKEIERLADAVQNAPEGPKKRRAVEDLLAYQASIKGTSITELTTAIWFANMLSGYMTQFINVTANATNVGLLYGNAIMQNPKSAPFVAKGLVEGLKRGLLEANETFETGYSPIKGKAEVPTLLERHKFTGFAKPLNYAKYVRRLMVAADVVFFEGLKEMRAYQMAFKQAVAEGKLEPTLDQRNRAIEIVGKSDGQLAMVQEQAELELEQEIEKINASELSPKEKKEAIEQAKSDNERRVFDLIEAQRGELIEETADFAAKGTYNYPPKGALGAFANAINQMVVNVPAFRFVVPFTNIIANVANETINYSPLGFARRKTGGFTNFRREPLTQQERVDLTTKAIIGSSLMVVAFGLSGGEDEPYLEITANGTGDYGKNEALKKLGWQQYSFRFKLPNGEYSGWVSYQYTPLLPSLALIGNYRDLTKYRAEKDDDTTWTRVSKAVGMTTLTFFQATYLDGLNSFLSNLLDPRRSESLVDKGIKTLTSTAKALAIPNLYTQIAKDLEVVFDAPVKEVRGTMVGSILQDIPYARNAYYDKINILGDEVMQDTDKFHSPNKEDKIIQLIVDKKAAWGAMNPKSEKIYDPKLKKERALTEQEFYDYSKTKGKFIKEVLTKNYDLYAKMDDEIFKKALTKIKTKATKKAKGTILGLIPKDEGEE